MIKKIALFVTIIFIGLFTCACDNEKTQVFYNKRPFSAETITENTNIFKPNERIYYLVTLPKKVQAQRLYIKIMKMGSKERLGYETVWARQVKLRDEQVHYYTDYIVLYETGAYVVQIYSKDDPTKLLATSQFYIRN